MASELPERSPLRVIRHPLVVLTALAGGVLLGLLAPRFSLALEPAGRIYRFLLEATILPIVVLAIAGGLSSLVQRPGTLRLSIQVLLLIPLLLLAAGAVALGVALVARPGFGLDAGGAAVLSDLIRRSPQGADTVISASASESGRRSALEGLTEIVPRNIFASLSAGSVIQAVLFSIIVGLAIGLLRDRQRDYLLGIVQSALAAFLKLNRWLIYLLPLGAVLLIAPRVAAADTTLLPVISRMLLTLGATLAGLSLIFGLVLWRRGGKSLGRTISALVEPLTYAFITGNSLSAIPYSLRAMEDRLGFSSERAQATLPVIAAVLRCGSAVTFVIAAAFVASFYGLSWSTAECATLLVAAALGSLVSAGAGGTAAIAGLGLAFAPLGLPDAPVTVMFAVAGLLVYPLLAAFEAHVALAASSLLCREPVVARARQRGPRLLSIRVTILSLITVLVVLTGAVCIGVMYSGQRKNIAYLADAMIDEISARVVQRSVNYLSPAERGSESLRYMMTQGWLDIHDGDALVRTLRNSLVTNPEFAAAYFGDSSGGFTMVKRMPDGSLSERLISRTEDSVIIDWRHENPIYTVTFPDSVDSFAKGYDPRSRGWYKSAAAAKARIWTDVYLFASDNMLGISNAIPVADPQGGLRGVVAVDIGLAELSFFLGGLDVSTSGKAFLLNEKDQLVALSVPRGSNLDALFSGPREGSATSTANLVPAERSGDPLVQQSFLAYLRAQRSSAPQLVRVEGERYLAAIMPFPADAAFHWKTGVVIPESTIYGYVNSTSRIVVAAALLIVVAAVGIGVSFSRAITAPLRRLSIEMERIRNFDLSGTERVQSGISEIHTMADSFSNMKHGLSAFAKYVPAKLVADLIELGEEPRIGGRKRKLTILFSDIADFTTVSEKLRPEKLVEEMAVYLGALGNAIMRNRGTVDKYIGDAIMALWNAPGEVPDHEVQACLAALECQDLLREMRRQGRYTTAETAAAVSVIANRTRMGIHTGEVVVGNMGSEERLAYTAVGDSVNLASRLEGLNKYYGTTVIASETTYEAARDVVAARLVDRVAVKGRTGGIEIYELMARRDRVSPAEERFIRAATEGVRHYLDGDFAAAIAKIREALAQRPDDSPSRIILDRCQEYLREPPPKEWKGVFIHHAK